MHFDLYLPWDIGSVITILSHEVRKVIEYMGTEPSPQSVFTLLKLKKNDPYSF
jgi:hypothetical protein